MTTFNETFEKIRLTAEADTANKGSERKRPSWGPALVLGDELAAALAGINHPAPEPRVARLWAVFAGTDRVSRYLRDHKSTMPMPEAKVRAFELRLGKDRAGLRLLTAKRHSSGTWEVRTDIPFKFPQEDERLKLNRVLRDLQSRIKIYEWQLASPQNFAQYLTDEADALLPDAKTKLAEAERTYAAVSAARDIYVTKHVAFCEMVRQRVAQFAGNAYAEMIDGAHVSGHCAICGRELSDPGSLMRGIGPECFGRVSPGLRRFLDQQEEVAA